MSAGASSPSGSMSPTAPHIRHSLDSDRSATSPPPINGINGHEHLEDDGDDSDPMVSLKKELARTRAEKNTLAAQYQNLLAKLTTMRTTLGNKLKQDAEELDRREALLQTMQARNEDLTSTIETLKTELIMSNEETERSMKELDALRTRTLNDTETRAKERELRETQSELERCRMQRDEWEQEAEKSKVQLEEAKGTVEMYKRDMDLDREEKGKLEVELEEQRDRAQNLQSVLEDFQAAKDHELRQAVKEHETQLVQVTQSLAEYKHRANTAEMQLEETQTDTSKTQALEKEVKEKNLLIGKLRYEAVNLNEHLIEALRRLRRASSDTKTSVDRRLVTNVLLQFLTTPREDAKRFEMLNLLSTVLEWNDGERERAGLQRGSGTHAPSRSSSGSFWSRSTTTSPSKPSMDLDKTDETESFSRLWVEFLLTEAASGSPPATNGPQIQATRSNPASPAPTTTSFFGGSLKAGSVSHLEIASLGLGPAPPMGSRKGREAVSES